MNNDSLDPEVRSILERREAMGLRISIIIILVFLSYFLVSLPFGATGSIEMILTGVLFLSIGCVLIALIWLLRNGKHLFFSGISLVIVVDIMIAALPFIWYYSVGWTSVPASFLLKTVVAQFSAGLIILSALPGRSVYPIATTAAGLIMMGSHLMAAIADPRSRFSSEPLRAYMGDSVFAPTVFFNMSIVAMVGACSIFLAFRFRRTVVETIRTKSRNDQLSRYFGEKVAQKMSNAGPDFFRPGGDVHEIAVLFSDLRSFTAMSESMEPNEVFAMLSEYHSRMTEAIFNHGGTIDKYTGDGIMATFGTPDAAPDDAARAIQSGMEMMKALDELNRARIARNLSPIEHGIGIHFGPAYVGNIGTERRLEYTAIGDTVNTTSRIESACKEKGRFFLVSRTAFERSRLQIDVEDIGTISVRGKQALIEVVAPILM